MKAVEQGNGYPLINPRTHEKTYIKANDLFNEICKQAWTTGDPGLFFIDAANNKNPTPWFGQFECVNPCGENPLLANESCNLGSIDVSKMVLENKKFDWDRLAEVVAISVRFLDNVITANNFPTIKIQRASLRTRKVGLGLMGFADTLILMGMRYDSEQAVKFAKRLMMNIRETAHMVSRDLGKEKGFGELERLKRRNATLTTIAPTGTLSILADCSSGIEPIFKKNFTKTVLGNVKINLGKKYQKIDDNLLITAGEISIEKHVEMQSAFQQYTDNAVSKTINLDNKSTVVDVTKAFKLAFASGCKGITIFRDGCRPEQMLENVTGELSECDGNKCSI
jgi:ribonucleoside-diphosphate reductase alpha chain